MKFWGNTFVAPCPDISRHWVKTSPGRRLGWPKKKGRNMRAIAILCNKMRRKSVTFWVLNGRICFKHTWGELYYLSPNSPPAEKLAKVAKAANTSFGGWPWPRQLVQANFRQENWTVKNNDRGPRIFVLGGPNWGRVQDGMCLWDQIDQKTTSLAGFAKRVPLYFVVPTHPGVGYKQLEGALWEIGC